MKYKMSRRQRKILQKSYPEGNPEDLISEEELKKERIHGGNADGVPTKYFQGGKYRKVGMGIEREHTTVTREQLEINKDHDIEFDVDPSKNVRTNYYSPDGLPSLEHKLESKSEKAMEQKIKGGNSLTEKNVRVEGYVPRSPKTLGYVKQSGDVYEYKPGQSKSKHRKVGSVGPLGPNRMGSVSKTGRVTSRTMKKSGWHGDRPGHIDAGKKASLTKLQRRR